MPKIVLSYPLLLSFFPYLPDWRDRLVRNEDVKQKMMNSLVRFLRTSNDEENGIVYNDFETQILV